MKQRLLLLLCSILHCAVAYSQHPHSSGGGPFYWALVGGIAAVLWFVVSLVFGNIKGILSFFQRIMGKKNQVKCMEQEGLPINDIEIREESQINSLPNDRAVVSYRIDNSSSQPCNNEKMAEEIVKLDTPSTNNIVSESLGQNGKTMKKVTKRKAFFGVALICLMLVMLAAAIGFINHNQEGFYEFNDMPQNKIDPIEEIHKMMSLDCLSDREQELWYKVNQQSLSRYNPVHRREVAQQMYEDQLFTDKFGEEEFNKTFGLPGSTELRRQQLENKLLEEAWIEAFGPKH